jgi:microcystin-dependent protein
MPDDPNGVHSLPAGYRAVDGEPILSSNHNPPLEDISAGLTSRLPRNGSAPMLANLAMGGNRITGLANGVALTDGVTLAQVQALIAGLGTPAGIVDMYAGASAPVGWLLCHGQAVSRTTYAALFAAISTTFGAGDGSTTFNLPDVRGEFIRGLDSGRGVDAGRTLGSAQPADIAAHGHTASADVTDPGHLHITPAAGNVVFGGSPGQLTAFDAAGLGTPTTRSSNSAITGISVAVTVNDSTGAETRPRNVAFNLIIKT